ncbi:MAG: hypothetical protein AB1633_13340 [Elusimicrobiota bacterium]
MPYNILILYPAAFEFETTDFRRLKFFIKAFSQFDCRSIILSPINIQTKQISKVLSVPESCQIHLFPSKQRLLPLKLGKKIESIYRFSKPWHERSWPLFIESQYYKYGEKIISNNEIDLIYSSFPNQCSIVSLVAAKKLARKYNKPLCFDFRDIPGEFGSVSPNELNQISLFIKSLLSGVELVTTVSEQCASMLYDMSGRSDIEIVYNGFDEETNSTLTELPVSADIFRIVFPGHIYQSNHIDILWDALDLLAQKIGVPDDVTIEFYGQNDYSAYHSLPLYLNSGRIGSKFVKEAGFVENTEMVRIERHSAALLLFSHPGALIGIFPSKGFEYMPIRRPILLIPDDEGYARNFLTETGYFESFKKPEDIAIWIEQYYSEWRSNGHRLRRVDINTDAVSKYSRQAQSHRMAELVKDIIIARHA